MIKKKLKKVKMMKKKLKVTQEKVKVNVIASVKQKNCPFKGDFLK